VTPIGTTAGPRRGKPVRRGKAASPLDCEAHPPNRDGFFPSTLETQAWRMAACFCSTDKRYAGDNRLMVPQRRHRRNRLAPRCRLNPSRGCRRSQGLDCSSIKGLRELGLDRRESGWPLSTAAVGALGVTTFVRKERVVAAAGAAAGSWKRPHRLATPPEWTAPPAGWKVPLEGPCFPAAPPSRKAMESLPLRTAPEHASAAAGEGKQDFLRRRQGRSR